MPLQSIYLNGGFVGITKSFKEDLVTTATPSFVNGTNYNLSTGSSFAYPSGIQEGDFIIVSQSRDSGGPSTAPSDSSSTSYSILVYYAGGDPDYLISYKFADGTESGTNITVAGGSQSGAAVIQIFRGINLSDPFDVTYTVANNGSGDPNPAAITPVTNNSMIVALGFLDDDSGVTVTAPTGYTNINYGESSAGGGADSVTMMASKLLATAGVEDPGTFVTSADDAWRTVTIALRRNVTTTSEYQSGIWNLQAVYEALSIINLINYDYETVYGTPSYTITTFPSTAASPGAGSNDVLVAIDANVSLTDDGILMEAGGSTGAGLTIGVNNGTIRVRAFRTTGDTAWNSDTGATFIEADISSYAGSLATYYIAIDASTFTAKLYVQPGGKGSTSEKILLGTDTADGSQVLPYGANGKGYGQINDQVADIGVAYEVTFNGTINEIRYWAENAAYDFSGF